MSENIESSTENDCETNLEEHKLEDDFVPKLFNQNKLNDLTLIWIYIKGLPSWLGLDLILHRPVNAWNKIFLVQT